jgi:UDP-N-acetylglucosamine--dolichyl-phosphate N-acetylglucosaminephosphotransferase
MCASLLAFFFYNKVPAKILPGDSLTYLLGGTIAVVAILGDMERAAIIASIPFFIEFILKIKGRVNKHSFGYEENGKIKNIYGKKIYSLPHILTRTGRFTERQIVWIFMGIELVFCLLMWVL